MIHKRPGQVFHVEFARVLVKMVKNEGENGKISIRNARHEALHGLKGLKNEGISEDAIKNGELDIQDITDSHTKKIDELINHKESEIMTI